MGRVVCACFNVEANTLTQAIQQRRFINTAEIGAALQAGSNCGSCLPELQKLLAMVMA
jgi:assimilatory nitrate reductase catalytic subunit